LGVHDVGVCSVDVRSIGVHCTGVHGVDIVCMEIMTFFFIAKKVIVRDGHGVGWSRKINAWHLYTLMVYL
jgi:hypothetical protein